MGLFVLDSWWSDEILPFLIAKVDKVFSQFIVVGNFDDKSIIEFPMSSMQGFQKLVDS